MEEVYPDTDCRTPVIFVLTAGAEPTTNLLRFTKTIKGDNLDDQMYVISLGQGQDETAIKRINQSLQSGSWVLL
jgi:dynein heavy chain